MKLGKICHTRRHHGGKLRKFRPGENGNVQSSWVLSQLPAEDCVQIRYEDLAADPAGTLDRIGRAIDLDLSGVADAIASGRPLTAGHTAGGNRMRMSKEIRLRPDFDWKRQLPAQHRKRFWRLAGWLARRYGYRPDGSVAPLPEFDASARRSSRGPEPRRPSPVRAGVAPTAIGGPGAVG